MPDLSDQITSGIFHQAAHEERVQSEVYENNKDKREEMGPKIRCEESREDEWMF